VVIYNNTISILFPLEKININENFEEVYKHRLKIFLSAFK